MDTEATSDLSSEMGSLILRLAESVFIFKYLSDYTQ